MISLVCCAFLFTFLLLASFSLSLTLPFLGLCSYSRLFPNAHFKISISLLMAASVSFRAERRIRFHTKNRAKTNASHGCTLLRPRQSRFSSHRFRKGTPRTGTPRTPRAGGHNGRHQYAVRPGGRPKTDRGHSPTEVLGNTLSTTAREKRAAEHDYINGI